MRDRGEVGRCALADQRALGHQSATDPSVDRRPHRGVSEVDPATRERGGPLVALGPVDRGLEAEQHVAPENLAAFLEHPLEHDARHACSDLGDPRGGEAPRQVVHAGDSMGRRHEHGRHLGGRRIGGRGRGLGRRVAAAADGEEDQQRLTPHECGSENRDHGERSSERSAHGRFGPPSPHSPDDLKIYSIQR